MPVRTGISLGIPERDIIQR